MYNILILLTSIFPATPHLHLTTPRQSSQTHPERCERYERYERKTRPIITIILSFSSKSSLVSEIL